MSTCTVGEISVVCPGGCGLICTSTHCWAWCEPTSVAVFQQGKEPAVLKASDSVKLCTSGLSRAALVEGLQEILETELESAADQDDAEDGDVSFSGTTDELLEHLGLRRRDGGAY